MKIAIVGNGKLSKNYGKQIDKCDLIIRFNHAKIKGYEDLVGTKTHILALVNPTKLAYQNEAQKIEQQLLKNCEWVLLSGGRKNKDYEKLLNKIVGKEKEYRYITYNTYEMICDLHTPNFKFDKNPSTGINVLCYILFIYDILENSHKLNIYGFDNFKSGHYFDSRIRHNEKFHDLKVEKQLIEYLKKIKNISFFN
jgi:hypothetical protein